MNFSLFFFVFQGLIPEIKASALVAPAQPVLDFNETASSTTDLTTTSESETEAPQEVEKKKPKESEEIPTENGEEESESFHIKRTISQVELLRSLRSFPFEEVRPAHKE